MATGMEDGRAGADYAGRSEEPTWHGLHAPRWMPAAGDEDPDARRQIHPDRSMVRMYETEKQTGSRT